MQQSRGMSELPSLSDLSVRDLTDRLASQAPVPGGGSAAALGGAIAAALVGMVAELTIGRAGYERHDEAARAATHEATELRLELLDLADRDAKAYGEVSVARKLPRGTDEERAHRTRELRQAMLEAARIPLQTARVAREVLDLAVRIAPIGNRNAISDAGVAAQLATAAVRGAILNVRINLPYLPVDEPLRVEAPRELAELEAAALQRQDEVLAAVEMGLNGGSAG
jgi:formiminotetrahydrofolate cyclodeaminase